MPTYTNATTVKQDCNVRYTDFEFADDASFTAWLDSLIARAEQLIDNFCHRSFKENTGVVEEHDGDGSRFLFPKYSPIISVASIKTRADKTSDWETIDANDYYVYRDYIYYASRWPIGRQNIQITYTHGYAAVPDAVKWICTRAVCNMLQYRFIDKQGPLIRVGDFTLQIPDHKILTPDLQDSLKPYVRIPAKVI